MKIPHRTVALANLNHWRAGQGAKIKANRPVEVYRACEFSAQLVAPIRDPLTLTQAEINTAIRRALTQRRNKEHGPIGKNADEWWTQLEAIASRWAIPLNRAEWEHETRAKPVEQAA